MLRSLLEHRSSATFGERAGAHATYLCDATAIAAQQALAWNRTESYRSYVTLVYWTFSGEVTSVLSRTIASSSLHREARQRGRE